MVDAIDPEPVDPRILFAAERTLFAYIRTGLALMGLGFVVARFSLFLRQLYNMTETGPAVGSTNSLSAFIGVALVICGIVLCGYSPFWYMRTVARLERGEPYTASRFGIGSLIALAVAVMGALMAVYLNLLR